jgi:carbonic anhydrase
MLLRLSFPFLLTFFTVALGQNVTEPIVAYHDRGENYVPPEDWGTVWPMCSFPNQSPIDLAVPASNLPFAADDLPLILELNSCQRVYDADVDELDTSPKWAFVETDCYAYGANGAVPHQIFHSDIHTPAEHTIGGESYDAEFHIGWRNVDSTPPKVLVVGFVFQGQEDAEEHPFLTKLLGIQTADVTVGDPVDLGKDWPAMLGLRSNTTLHGVTFFNYIGSGDVPPCLGGIDWWIADKPITVAQSQIDDVHAFIQTMPQTDDGKNARPIQSLDDREVRTGDYDDDETSASSTNSMTLLLTAGLWTFQLLVVL